MVNFHPKLSHLTEHQVDNLIERYYKGESIKTLIDEYRINVIPSNFVSILPNLVDQDTFCPYCENINMERKRVSRNALNSPEKNFVQTANIIQMRIIAHVGNA